MITGILFIKFLTANKVPSVNSTNLTYPCPSPWQAPSDVEREHYSDRLFSKFHKELTFVKLVFETFPAARTSSPRSDNVDQF